MKLLEVTFRDPVSVPGATPTRFVRSASLDALYVEGPMVVMEKGDKAKAVPLSNVVESTPAPKAKK